MQEQGFAGAIPPVIGKYEKVFQEKRGQRQKSRIRFEHDSISHRTIIDGGQIHIETGMRSEGVPEQPLTRGMIRRRKAFVIGQGVNKFQKARAVIGDGFPDAVRFP